MASKPLSAPLPASLRGIGIFGHVGKGNLGDEATIAAVIQHVRRRCPDASIYGFTLDPGDTAARHHIPTFPIRPFQSRRPSDRAHGHTQGADAPSGSRPSGSRSLRNSLKNVPGLSGAWRSVRDAAHWLDGTARQIALVLGSLRALRKLDLLLVAGSNQLSDYFGGGPWGFPFTLLGWVVAARLVGVRVAFVSAGAGPIALPLGKRFLRWTLLLAHYRSYRDLNSCRLVQSLGLRSERQIYPDLVHSLEIPGRAGRSRPARPIIGINPLPFFDPRYWPESSEALYARYVHTLARFALRLIETGHDVLLFPTQLTADPPVVDDIELVIKREGPPGTERHLLSKEVRGFADLVDAIAMSDIVVASRFHGIVISAVVGTPVLALSYYAKTDDLMRSLDLAEFTLDLTTLEVDELVSRFQALEAKAALVRDHLTDRARDYRAALDVQYDRLIALGARRAN